MRRSCACRATRLRIREEHSLTECDRAGVLHRAGRKIGNADDVELAERILDAVVPVVKASPPARAASSANPVERQLVGRRADANRRCRRPILDGTRNRRRASPRDSVDIFGVVAKTTVCLPGPGRACRTSLPPFEIAWSPLIDHQRERRTSPCRLARRMTGTRGARRSLPSASPRTVGCWPCSDRSRAAYR